MKAYLDDLNDVQKRAVTHMEGPVLVIAGPGSGKTRVLTFRVAHLIEEGVAPWEILTLTFTNKSAREMKERIGQVIGPKTQNVWAGTFHSIFAKILRIESSKIGYDSNFTIYDTDDSRSLINSIIKELNLDKSVYNANAIKNRISSAKSNLISPKAYVGQEDLMQKDRMSKRPYFHVIYEKYVERCKRSGAMDFDDLLYQLYILLHKNPDNVKEKYQKKFKYILVDEFQDTNYLQNAILKKLVNYEDSKRNIFVVGDDAQSIYAFRGATIDNILDFEKEYKKHNISTYKLEQNYRSTDHIVQAANEVITHNSKQIPKKIWSDKGVGQKIKVIRTNSDAEEGKRIVDTILEQKSRNHLQNDEIAILYRTNAQSRVFEEYLRRYNLTYKVYGGLSFYSRKEVKDLLGYLRLSVNQNDEEALRRVINYPKRGIGNSSIDKINAFASQSDISMWEAMTKVPLSARAKNSLLDFKAMIEVFSKKAKSSNAYELAYFVAKQSGITNAMKGDTSIEGLARMENVTSLLDGIKDFVENDEAIDEVIVPDKSISTYLQNIALVSQADSETDSTDFITLMSVHSAKGLEYKSVFVVGLEEKLFPSFMSMETKEGLDEERRLFYVAITRAEQFLTLSFATSRFRFGKHTFGEPSRFLNEISSDHLETTFTRRSSNQQSSVPVLSGVKGNFRKKAANNFAIDAANFKASPSENIQVGMKVLHMKFGEGKVLSIEGGNHNKIATIFFKQADNPQKRIVLRFSKLQIVT